MKKIIITIIITVIVIFGALALIKTVDKNATGTKALGTSITDYKGGLVGSYGINLQFMHAVAVSKSDTTVLPVSTLYVGTTGDVAVTMLGGEVVTFKSVPVGFMPILVTKVMATNTTASNIMALQ